MHKAFVYRLYPTTKQVEQLTWVLDRCRELYNAALNERRDAYRMAGKSLGYCDQAAELPGLKDTCPEFKQVGSQVLQNVLAILTTKAAGAGRVTMPVDPRNTSQTCVCGEPVPKDLGERWHDCPRCHQGLRPRSDAVQVEVDRQR